DFDNHLKRNAAYVMEEQKPEYLLIFLNHQTSDPSSQGWPYPAISNEVWKHPARKNYVEMKAIPKIGNVHNHILRRKDVAAKIPEEVNLESLVRTIERNPGMPYLYYLLCDQAGEMGLTEEQQARVDAKVRDGFEAWPGNPEAARIARGRKGSPVGTEVLRESLRKDPRNLPLIHTLADIYESQGKTLEMIEVLELGVPHLPDNDNFVIYRLIFANEKAGQFEKARKWAELAIDRLPAEPRAWSDYASLLDRRTWKIGRAH